MSLHSKNNTASADSFLLQADDIAEISVAEVDARLQRDHFVCLRGLFDRAEIAAGVASLRAGFSAERDQPAAGEKPGAVMQNFQKLAIGGNDQAWVYNPRFVRVMYNPLWADDIYGLRGIFRRLAQVRNRLEGYELDYAVDQVQDRLWTASRVQHYPAGGGFMGPHRDVVLETVERDSGVEKFYQILLLLTTKGADFERGGAFIDTETGRIDLEAQAGAGDILIYSGRSLHGVEDIDPHRVLRLDRLEGRLVAMVSLYKDMSGEKELFGNYADRKQKRQSFA
ncbi:MAG: hypothetical protein ACPGO3_07845 [Magnetospiraceae bacterium]